MADDDRPDLKELRRKLTVLVSVIVVTVITLVAMTFYLYARFSGGGRVTP